MFNAMPSTWSEDDLAQFVGSIKGGAEYIFLTDVNLRHADIYASFGRSWDVFVRLMAS